MRYQGIKNEWLKKSKQNLSTWRKISYCLKCGEKKQKKQNIYGVALENKIGQQRSMHTDCDSEKSTFLKPMKKQNSFCRL